MSFEELRGGGAVSSKYVADIRVFKSIFFIVIYLKGVNLSLACHWRLIAWNLDLVTFWFHSICNWLFKTLAYVFRNQRR